MDSRAAERSNVFLICRHIYCVPCCSSVMPTVLIHNTVILCTQYSSQLVEGALCVAAIAPWAFKPSTAAAGRCPT